MSGQEKESIPITTEVLQRYIELEKLCLQHEGKNAVKNYKMKKEQFNDVSETVKTLEKQYKKCCEQTDKEKADVDKMQEPNVKNFFKDKESFDKQMSKEQEEYLEALNKQEVVKKQLDGVTVQRDQLEKEMEGLKGEADKIEAIYTEREELLSGIFNGSYGSDLENKLESDLDVLKERKERISTANYKWTNARVLLEHGCNQMAFAVQRWQDVKNIDPKNMQLRYQVATETRNNLIAAIQNVASAQRYLSNIDFPYCKPAEVDTLNKATNNIYIDMNSHERHQHAFQCYHITHRRGSALLQWFDNVINNTITKDLKKANDEAKAAEKALRNERLKLIKDLIEKSGGKVDLDEAALSGMSADDYREDQMEPELVALAEPDEVTGADDLPGDDKQDPCNDRKGAAPPAPTPVPLNELAPPPSQEEIFGNIDNLRKQHEKEKEEFQKAQDMNKVRLQQGLEEKLAERRNRRMRMTPAPEK